jgi:hypothetical protein
MMLDPISRLTVVNTRMSEQRRAADDARLARMAARAEAEARSLAESIRRHAPAGRVPTPRIAHAGGRRG